MGGGKFWMAIAIVLFFGGTRAHATNYALYKVHQHPTEAGYVASTGTLRTQPIPPPDPYNSGNSVIPTDGQWYAIYRIKVTNAQANDLFRIRGQFLATNLSPYPVLAQGRITVNGGVQGTFDAITVTKQTAPASTGIQYENRNHAGLICDAYYAVPSSGNYTIEIQAAAATGLPVDQIIIEHGHGVLIAEHYRPYATHAAAAGDLASVLTGVHHQGTAQISQYPSAPPPGTEATAIKNWSDGQFAYQLDVSAAANDTIRLFGMALGSASYANQTYDGPVLGIWRKGNPTPHTIYSPWIIEGYSPDYQVMSQWNTALDTIASAGSYRYFMSIHGSLERPSGVGGNLSSSGGYLTAFRYSRQTTEGLAGGRYLQAIYETTTGATFVGVNGTWQDIVNRAITVQAGDVAKLTGAILYSHPGPVADKVACNLIASIETLGGTVVAQSPIALKEVSKYLLYLPERVELAHQFASGGTYYFKIRANCQGGGSSFLDLNQNGTKHYVEIFR